MFQSPSEGLAVLGDQPRLSETAHSRRARFHQSWYRAARLGILEWGATAKGRPLGSILPPTAAAAGANFTSDESYRMFRRRRLSGWGVDPVRMTSHMTSSQTLLTNLLGPLVARPAWLLAVLADVLGRSDFSQLRTWDIEFAPPARSHYLGDMTRVDALFVVDTLAGPEAVVLELKYADRFSSRRLNLVDNPRYVNLAVSSDVWNDHQAAFAEGATSQLLRCHALGMRTLQVDHNAILTTLLLVSHPQDPVPSSVFDRYKDHLRHPESAVHVRLNQMLDTAASLAISDAETSQIAELKTRYLSHALSEALWSEHRARSIRN